MSSTTDWSVFAVELIVTTCPLTVNVPAVTVLPTLREAKLAVLGSPLGTPGPATPATPSNFAAVAFCVSSKTYCPTGVSLVADALQSVVELEKAAERFKTVFSDPNPSKLDFKEVTKPLISFRALVFEANLLFSARIRFCGVRLTSMS